jgi:hypothetical protein
MLFSLPLITFLLLDTFPKDKAAFKMLYQDSNNRHERSRKELRLTLFISLDYYPVAFTNSGFLLLFLRASSHVKLKMIATWIAPM